MSPTTNVSAPVPDVILSFPPKPSITFSPAVALIVSSFAKIPVIVSSRLEPVIVAPLVPLATPVTANEYSAAGSSTTSTNVTSEDPINAPTLFVT